MGWVRTYLDDLAKHPEIGRAVEEVVNENQRETSDQTDFGATCWKVTSVELRIALFGFMVMRQHFSAGTSRIWRTTYLDDEIRIVRAGKTGRPQDEYVFIPDEGCRLLLHFDLFDESAEHLRRAEHKCQPQFEHILLAMFGAWSVLSYDHTQQMYSFLPLDG